MNSAATEQLPYEQAVELDEGREADVVTAVRRGLIAKHSEHRTKLDGFLRNEDGISAIIFAICLPVFVATAALAIDMGYAYLKRTDLQTTASASSLAGAGTLKDDGIYDPVNEVVIFGTVDPDGDGVPNDPDSAVIFTEALLYAENNLPSEDVLAAIDLHAGNWEPTTRIFTSAGTWDSGSLTFTAASIVAGIVTRMRVPRPGCESIFRIPFTSSALS